MEFLNKFSLEDVAIVFIGLVIVSIIRIWFEAYVNRKKATRFGSSLSIYNNLLDDTKEGLFIISDDAQIIFSNIESRNILNLKEHSMDSSYLETIIIEDTSYSKNENLLNLIYTKTYIPNAFMVDKENKKSISISINTFKPNKYLSQTWYIVILQDMTQISKLRDGAQTLLAA